MPAVRDEWLIWPPLPALLRRAEQLTSSASFQVPASHRPVVGRAVTAAKRLLLRSLLPLRRKLLAPQQRFNLAAVEAVQAAAQGLPLPARLEELAALPDSLAGAKALLARQRTWNLAFVAALRGVGRASPEQAETLHSPLTSTAPLVPGPLFELLRQQAELNRTLARLSWALLGLHATSVHEHDGYRIPRHLLELTGAGADTWEAIARKHLRAYALSAPIEPHHALLEVGCGVGRDAMHLAPLLANGSYVGIDVTAPSIEWCRRNITARHPRFTFFHLDVGSELYNPSGRLSQDEVALPVADASIDRIVLQSVFTHLFSPAVARYLAEFRRVLKPGGLVYASLFYLDEASLGQARRGPAPLTFRHARGQGCLVDSALAPEEAVGFTPQAFSALVAGAGLGLVKLVPGSWPGRPADGYQDAAILSTMPSAGGPRST